MRAAGDDQRLSGLSLTFPAPAALARRIAIRVARIADAVVKTGQVLDGDVDILRDAARYLRAPRHACAADAGIPLDRSLDDWTAERLGQIGQRGAA